MAVWHDGQEPTIGLASDAPGSRPPDRQALAEIGDSAARLATAAGAPCSGADDRTRPGGRPTGTAGAVIGPFAVPVHPPTPGLTGYLGSFSMRTALLVRFDRPWLRGAVLVADLRPGSLADAPRILLSVSALVQVTFEGRLAARREQALHDALSRQVGEAETLKAELTGFTARVCHHLQEPVRRIESIFRLLGRRFAGGLSGKERRCLAGLLQSGRILKERIQNLHRLYRLEQDRTPLEPVQLGKILKEVVRHLDQSIRRRRARISVSSLPWVTANPSQLRELFSSLLCCALHHSPPGKCEMRIGALRWAGDPPGYVRCFIKNSHGSVPSRQSERVRRAISGDSRCDALGELLGLTIARKVVSRHGGRIWMEATPDGGCAFFFTLPACHRRAQPRETDPDPAYPPPPAPARSSPGAQPTSLLLVCPDPLDQETLSEGLRGSVPGGASITTVTSILEALQMTRERHFDLVVSQTDLPDGTGLDLARKLAAGASQLPLVLVGPKGDEASVLEALQAGAADYVRNDELVQASLREAASVVLSNLESERLLARLRSDFVAMVGHDLRNPVANVLSYTDILLDDGLHRLAPEHHQAAVRIKKNALFMMALIGDILDTVRIESGSLRIFPTLLDLREIIKDAREKGSVAASEKQIQLVFVQPDRPLLVHVDPAKILRVLLNLVSNAIKFSPSGRQVEVGVAPWVAPATDDSQPREWACLWVKDEGLGIPQDEVTKLFKKFSATSVRPTAGEKGTGLGLYIVKEIVELHQGCVEVETRPGRGSTFRVLLPSAGEP